MEDKDSDFLKDYHLQIARQKKEMLHNNKDLVLCFTAHCEEKFGINIQPSDIDFIERIGIVAHRKNLLKDICPDLPVDKDGLVPWTFIKEKLKATNQMAGYFNVDNFIAMVHSGFRRGMHIENNWSPSFVESFWKHDDQNIESFIALDYDTIRINKDPFFLVELDTWFGPPFSENIDSISDGISKLRPPLDIPKSFIDLFFNDVHSLDIKWSTKGCIKTFQSLEFKSEGIKIKAEGSEFHPAKYMHAEYDLKTHSFRHFDGAIQYFTPEEYNFRVNGDFNFDLKGPRAVKAKYQKLFKFNGVFDKKHWANFCSHFYTGNPLIYEYFNGELPSHLLGQLEIIRKRQNTT